MPAKYKSLRDLHDAVARGEEDMTRIKVWVDNDSTNAWEWNEDSEDQQGQCLVRLGTVAEAAREALSLLGYSAEHV